MHYTRLGVIRSGRSFATLQDMFERLQQKIETWYDRSLAPYERYIPLSALILGFIWDSFTLNRPDQFFDNFVLVTYLSIAAGTIILLNIRQRELFLGRIPLVGIMQFSFGNLASGILVLYFKSGTLAGSALFLGLLITLLVGNEFLRTRYAQAHFHIAVWYVLLLSYLVMVVPVVIGSISVWVFILSGLMSLAVVALMLFVMYSIAAHAVKKVLPNIALSVGLMFIAFNGLYFANLIPPVPLSLRHIGVYHTLERTTEGNYLLTYEHKRWWEFLQDTSSIYTRGPGEDAFCFSSVFAPGRLSSPIYHRWEYWDETTEEWNTELRVLFNINAGRDEGYRGYTQKIRLWPGTWRCNVETERGILIGRTTFELVEASSTPELLEREL